MEENIALDAVQLAVRDLRAQKNDVAANELADAHRKIAALHVAAKNVLWKLDRTELSDEGEPLPAKIDRNDVVIRHLLVAFLSTNLPSE